MPIYDYLCTSCDHRADILHGINDPGPHYCPSCGEAGTMRKQFAVPAVHFKGTGWAKKDRGGSSAATKASLASGDAAKTADAKPSGTDASSGGDSTASSGTESSSSSSGSTSSPASASGGTPTDRGS